jgi:arylformamidase
MASGPITPPLQLTLDTAIATHGVNITHVSFPVHMATHVDAPRHFYPQGRTIDQFGLENTSGPAVCWSFACGASEVIDAHDLAAMKPELEEGDLLFIHTGWDKLFGRDEYKRHPYLDASAARWLADRKIALLGIDTQTPDQPIIDRQDGFDWPVHKTLLGADILIAENLAHLDRVSNRRFTAYAWPIPLVGADGAPARIVAQLDDETDADSGETGRPRLTESEPRP